MAHSNSVLVTSTTVVIAVVVVIVVSLITHRILKESLAPYGHRLNL